MIFRLICDRSLERPNSCCNSNNWTDPQVVSTVNMYQRWTHPKLQLAHENSMISKWVHLLDMKNFQLPTFPPPNWRWDPWNQKKHLPDMAGVRFNVLTRGTNKPCYMFNTAALFTINKLHTYRISPPCWTSINGISFGALWRQMILPGK